jgi:hypothetical protein
MKFIKFIVLVLTLLFLYSLTLSAEDRGLKLQIKRQALVIGNGAYQTAPLNNPLNDAEDMATTLKNLGFEVILRKNADQRTMEDAIRYFGRQLRDGGVGLFYFAGHGVQVEGRNYLMPIDARIESESDVKYEAVDAGRVLGKMEDAENQLNIIILDACRNNPYARAFRTDQNGLARMDAPTGSLIAYATAPGEVAADGPERNGIFTKHLIQHMKTPNLAVEQVLKRVRIAVSRQTNGRQIPWESSSLMGDFYFNPQKTSKALQSSGSSGPAPSEKTTVAALPRTDEKAAVSNLTEKPVEPWTGVWKVEGTTSVPEWNLKQKGNIVEGSAVFFSVKGKVMGSQLKGRLYSAGEVYYFVLNMSRDNQSFEGRVRESNQYIKGTRKK